MNVKRCATWGRLPIPKNRRFVGKRNRFAAFLRRFSGCEDESKAPKSEEEVEKEPEKDSEEKDKDTLPKKKKCILFNEMYEDNQKNTVNSGEKKAAMKAIDEQCAALNEALAPDLDRFMEARTSCVELSQDFWKKDNLFVVEEKKAKPNDLESECILQALMHAAPIPTPSAVIPEVPHVEPYDPLLRDMPQLPPELLDRAQRLKNLLMDKDRLKQQQRLIHLVPPEDPLEAIFLPKLEHRSGGKDIETLEMEKELLLQNHNCDTGSGIKISPDSCAGKGISHGWDSINSLQSGISAASSSADTVYADSSHAYSVVVFEEDTLPMDVYPADDSPEDEKPLRFPTFEKQKSKPGKAPHKAPYEGDEDSSFLNRTNTNNQFGVCNRSSSPSSSPKASAGSMLSGDVFISCCEVDDQLRVAGRVKKVTVAMGQVENMKPEENQKTEDLSDYQSLNEYHSENQIEITEYSSEKDDRQSENAENQSEKVRMLLANPEDQCVKQKALFPPKNWEDSDGNSEGVRAADFGMTAKVVDCVEDTYSDEGEKKKPYTVKKERIPDLGKGRFVPDEFAAMGVRWCREKPLQIEGEPTDGDKVVKKPKKVIDKDGDFRASFKVDEFTLRALLWVGRIPQPGSRLESTDRLFHYMEHFYWSRLTKDSPHFHWFVNEGLFAIHYLLIEKQFKEIDVMANKDLDKELLEYIKMVNKPGGPRVELTDKMAYFMVTSYFKVLHARATQRARPVEDRFLMRSRFAVTVLETFFQEQGLRAYQSNLNCAELLTWSLKHEGRLFAINEEALEYAADRRTVKPDSMIMRTPNQEAFKDFYERQVLPRPDALAINPCLRSIRRYPSENLDDRDGFRCPIKGCGMELVSSQLMTHFLTDHCRRIEELWVKDRMVLLFYPRSYPAEQLYCICVVALRPDTPTSRGVAELPEIINNEELPPRLYYFSVHVPCLLMYCQVSQSIIKKKRKKNHDEDSEEKRVRKSEPSANDPEAQLYIFWLASNENEDFSDIACRLYVYCQDRSVKSNALLNFVVMSQFRGIEDLVNNHPECYLALDHPTMVTLTKDFKELLFLDLRYVSKSQFHHDMSGDESWNL